MDVENFRIKYKYELATNILKQYLDVKFEHQDCLVLFRMGDFYELFYEDAIFTSNLLSITLTKRSSKSENHVPMCGVPFHALENYLPQLIESGRKIAICEQIETPQEAKKRAGHKAVIKREVVRIITPGTITEDSALSHQKPNYLASIAINPAGCAIAYADINTGEFFVSNICENQIASEIARISPLEVLISDKFDEVAAKLRSSDVVVSSQVDSFFAYNKCYRITADFYRVRDVSSLGEFTKPQIQAIGSVAEYISLTQKSAAPQMLPPKIIQNGDYISIDSATQGSLQIFSKDKNSLFGALSSNVTPQGSRLLHQFLNMPLSRSSKINERLLLVEFLKNNMEFTRQVRNALKEIGDLERLLIKISTKRAAPSDLLTIKSAIEIAAEIRKIALNKFGLKTHTGLDGILSRFEFLGDLCKEIGRAINEEYIGGASAGGFINPLYHSAVDRLQTLACNAGSELEKLRKKYISQTGIDNLKIQKNNVLGYFIEVTNKSAAKITSPEFTHKQSTLNNARYSTAQLDDLANKISIAGQELAAIEQKLFEDLSARVIAEREKILNIAGGLARIDLFCNFAYIADKYNYVMPAVDNSAQLEIIGGRHPVVERALEAGGAMFVKNDAVLNKGKRLKLLTGPNMSGKSTFLRQNAIITIMAQIGCFVPAGNARIGVVDKIFSRIGSGDDLAGGRSTFMVEMSETAAILNQATDKSLIILDEVGRGTSTYDGVAIASAITEHIHSNIKCRCFFATHYHELTELEHSLPYLGNLTTKIKEQQTGQEKNILFLHNVIDGSADKSYGIHVARLAGIENSIIRKAYQIQDRLQRAAPRQQKMEYVNVQNSAQDEAYKTTCSKLQDLLSKHDINQITPVKSIILLEQVIEVISKLKEESKEEINA